MEKIYYKRIYKKLLIINVALAKDNQNFTRTSEEHYINNSKTPRN